MASSPFLLSIPDEETLVLLAESFSVEPFTPQRDQTDGDPHRIEPCGGVRFECERVNDQKDAPDDVHALISKRIALDLLERHQRVGKEKQD